MHTIAKSSTTWQSKMNGETSSIVMGTVSLQEDFKDNSRVFCSAVSNLLIYSYIFNFRLVYGGLEMAEGSRPMHKLLHQL